MLPQSKGYAHFEAGSMAVDLHLRQDHLGAAIKWLTALGAQVLLMHDSVAEYYHVFVHLEYIVKPLSTLVQFF